MSSGQDAKRDFCDWHERGYWPDREEPGLVRRILDPHAPSSSLPEPPFFIVTQGELSVTLFLRKSERAPRDEHQIRI